MAYLNVRERRIETKIAYVGPELAGKATNFDHLGQGVTSVTNEDDLLALDWKPAVKTTFRDCDVMVRLVASRGALTDEGARAILRDVDGVVFVADAHPSAQARNRSSLDIVKAALAAAARPDVPVVVQLNKVDLPDALALADVTSALDVASWPHVAAAALRGEGVRETAERALAEVIESLRRSTAGGERDPEHAVAIANPRTEGNPLLASLREVLRETVREHVAEIEARIHASLEDRLEVFFTRVLARQAEREGAEIAALRRVLVDEISLSRAAIDATRERVDVLDRTIRELGSAVAVGSRESVRSLTGVSAMLASVEDAVRRQEPVDTGSLVERVKDDVRNEVTRVVDSRARAEREHLATAVASLKRAIETVSTDVRGTDAKPMLGGMKTTLEAVSAQTTTLTTQVAPTVSAVRALTPRLADMEAAIVRDVRESVVRAVERVEERVASLREETGAAHGKTDATADLIHALLGELVEELKKPKKSWFG